MEQDVEPKQRSYGRDWGHDNRCEAAPQEPAPEERRKSHGDKRARGRSKRPDQQIYVPRARRGPHQVDSESVDSSERKPGIPLEQEDAHETEQRSRTRPGRGRARASVERYVPKARRNANEAEKNQDEDSQEGVNSGQFENHKTPDKSRRKSSEKSHKSNDKSSDRSSDKPSDSRPHSKKTKSKRSRSSSEKEGKQVSEMCLKKSPTFMKTEDIKDHTSHDSVIQGSGDQQFLEDSLSALSNTTQDYSNALNDNVPGPGEVANIAQNEIDDSKSDVKGSDLMEFESTEKTADILEAKDIEAIERNAVDSCETPEELNACDKGGGDSSNLLIKSESEVVSNVDLDGGKELEESIAESKELETKDSIIDEDSPLSNEDLEECSNVPSAVIKRENSFVENLEIDNTLQVSYSENCHYDMELEKGDETRQTTDICDAEQICETADSNDCSPSSIDIGESENVNMPIAICDQSAFNPAKRRKSRDADLETELMVDHSCSQDKTECQPTDSQVILDNKDSRVSELDPKSAVASCVNETEKSNNSPVDSANIAIGTPPSSDSQNSEQNISSINPETQVSNFLKMTDSHAMPSNVPESELDKSGLDNIHNNQIPVAKDVSEATEDNGVVMETAEDSWDAMFDDDGEALDPHIMDELTQKVGKVKVQKTQFDYLEFQPADPELDDEGYAHLVEIYDFPSDLITRDLLAAFRSFQDKGFDLKWVDDTHCIGIFSSKIAAQTALEISNPLIKVRPIASASRQTKLKAKKYASSLEPYKPRPVTTAAVARNLVTNALGLTSRVPRAKRDEERRKLKEAREKKKEAKQLENDVWDGKVGRCAMDEV